MKQKHFDEGEKISVLLHFCSPLKKFGPPDFNNVFRAFNVSAAANQVAVHSVITVYVNRNACTFSPQSLLLPMASGRLAAEGRVSGGEGRNPPLIYPSAASFSLAIRSPVVIISYNAYNVCAMDAGKPKAKAMHID